MKRVYTPSKDRVIPAEEVCCNYKQDTNALHYVKGLVSLLKICCASGHFDFFIKRRSLL